MAVVANPMPFARDALKQVWCPANASADHKKDRSCSVLLEPIQHGRCHGRVRPVVECQEHAVRQIAIQPADAQAFGKQFFGYCACGLHDQFRLSDHNFTDFSAT
jgi:hypothetical protein